MATRKKRYAPSVKLRSKTYKQKRVGSSLAADRTHTAKKPGWRKSKKGKYYFENRSNRSDRSKKKKL